MDSNTGGSDRPNDRHQVSIEAKTKHCLSLINHSSNSKSAKVILLIGRPGVGKSSLLEYITGATGHSCHGRATVTRKFQIEVVTIEEEQFFIMDTPGFNTGAEADALTEIARGMQLIKAKTQIVGIWHVSRITGRNEAFDDKLRVFLHLFCGTEYIPQVTFVTTHWTPQEEDEEYKAELNNNLEDFKRDCRNDFLNYGAQFYQHGRRYVNGEDTGEFLKWRGDREEVVRHVKDMIHRQCGSNNTTKVPSFVRELELDIPFQQTDAAKSLGVFPDTTDALNQEAGSQGARSGTAPGEDSSSQPNISNGGARGRDEQNEAPRQGESSAHGQEPEEAPPGLWASIYRFVTSLQPEINVSSNGVSVSFSSAGPGQVRGNFPLSQHGSTSSQPFSSRQPHAWPSGLDWNSSVDHMKARNLDPSLKSRTQMANSWGVKLPGEPGTAEWGSAFHRELNRRDPF